LFEKKSQQFVSQFNIYIHYIASIKQPYRVKARYPMHSFANFMLGVIASLGLGLCLPLFCIMEGGGSSYEELDRQEEVFTYDSFDSDSFEAAFDGTPAGTLPPEGGCTTTCPFL
jgi:hypothetical protein